MGTSLSVPLRQPSRREIAALSLDDIRITNGTVRYSDERNGAWGHFDGINARFSLPAMREPLTASGTVVAEGEPFDFKSTLTTPQDLAEQRPAKLALTVTGAPLKLQLRRHGGLKDARARIRQLIVARRLGALVGHRSVAGSRRGRSRLLSQAECHAERACTSPSIDLKARRAAASGTVGFEEREGARPHVAADLKISGLNVAELPLGADVRAANRPAVPAPTPLALPPRDLIRSRRSRTRSTTCSSGLAPR